MPKDHFAAAELALLTPLQMDQADREAEAVGVSGSVLMEAAGAAVAVVVCAP